MSFKHVATTYLGPGQKTQATVSRHIYECNECETLLEGKNLESHRCPLEITIKKIKKTMDRIDVKATETSSYLPADAFGNHMLIFEDHPPGRTPGQQITFHLDRMTRDGLIDSINRQTRRRFFEGGMN